MIQVAVTNTLYKLLSGWAVDQVIFSPIRSKMNICARITYSFLTIAYYQDLFFNLSDEVQIKY